MLTISLPDQGEPSAERLRFFNRRCAVLKQYLDRQYGKQPPPVWCTERGAEDHLHGHRLLGDYGYVDLPRLRKWMLRNGMCDLAQDGRLVPWYLKYELLRNQDQAIRYVAAYVAKSATTSWPKHARTRYVPIPEPKREPAPCGPHRFKYKCQHLNSRLRPALQDVISLAEVARVDCFDCLAVIRSALDAWQSASGGASRGAGESGGHGVSLVETPATLTALSSMSSYTASRHGLILVRDKIGQEGVK